METNPEPSGDEGSLKNAKERCTALQAQVDKVEKDARGPVKRVPKVKVGSYKCDAYKLSAYSTHCGNNCRAFYALDGWRLNVTGEQPPKDKVQNKTQENPDPWAYEKFRNSVEGYCAKVRA
ncbi:uncharacterized protein G6M90_00g093330 [Metarhizium brunneum]|uniref:Uncharacterized protein n=1 Tax=Metarhizium brunneum TaxID=500148 RepID=A0A7D5YXL5_9HYPO